MASATPLQMIDDDDEFDWEAAVREIDVACEATALRNSNSYLVSFSKPENSKPSTSRQSTLDKFIGLAGAKAAKNVENQTSRHVIQDEVECDDERVSSVKIDTEAAKTWIFPVGEHVPVRDYQESIARTALFSNTLVSLPTGLGKTLIAAVVMYNYFRWFPEGKIVFAAPSRPLVMQQIEACHNTVGIPQEWTIDMTGQTSPTRRACLWKAKRVFFVTPQVLEKDIQSGSCLVKHLVCLVIDEAHRASGNYSYCVAVRELMAVPVQVRILALTATPGSKQQTVQQIIDNLQISTLEYRNESDPDVTPYTHDRKIELIEVAMGQDAVVVNNLLLDVIHPFVARLSAMGLLQKRDLQTLSPCDLLNSRDKFRQAPPQDLHQLKYGEVEGFFGVLITLYHIRKLLSSHGIRPAYEMLEEKLKQGSLARFLSRNEVLWKAKVLMQQNLSHGILSPKFSKMLEVLIEHFKTRDPQKSRVIIFSNFRGSVRDIMKALSTIGEYVKATEFIGQSSGKTSKGQSQKVQQAVLEKFRSGGYNVIVATSIGEEGLDIMEVDLVICFDANVSPLRMIQRMGRTGRKNEGRVVVLACEGSELKGYMRKQANSRAINKHMRNGGLNSFRFHSSPRMVPHVFKPERRYVKLDIKEFVPRGKKVKDDNAMETPEYEAKLTDAETEVVAKYFHSRSSDDGRLSLIAYPHFQAFPSGVHEVPHSVRTGMLIDTMRCLQELLFSNHSKAFFGREEETSKECFRSGNVEHCDDMRGLRYGVTREEPESNALSPMDTSRIEEKHDLPNIEAENAPSHSFLFGSDFVSVDPLGKVLVLSVPLLPLKQFSPSKGSCERINVPLNCAKPNSRQLRDSLGEYEDMALDAKRVRSTKGQCQENNDLLRSTLRNSSDVEEERLAGDATVLRTEISNLKLSSTEVNAREKTTPVEENESLLLADESINDSKDADFSPRLTNLLKSGVVPESPIDNGTLSKGKGEFMSPAIHTPAKLHTPVNNLGSSSLERCISASKIVEEIRTPLTNLSGSCSKDWIINSGEKSESIGPKKKLKRLRKYGDVKNRRPFENEETVVPEETFVRSCAETESASHKHGRGEKKLSHDIGAFIEEEAEVSSEVAISDDEEDDHEQDSYDDSFIDDRINPTVASTQADAARCDMMAIYRRSLLSQSPIRRKPKSDHISPHYAVPTEGMLNGRSSVETSNPSLGTFLINNGNSSSVSLNFERFSAKAVPTIDNGHSRNNESRKRKLCFAQGGSLLPIRNLEQEISFDSEAACKESSEQDHVEQKEGNMDAFDNDEFYRDIDLDALEEQATKQLRSKTESSLQNGRMNPNPISQDLDFLGSPSFDLGI